MLIECTIKRKNGTRASIDGQVYHFAPRADGAHVAEVTKPAHIQRFLSITEGYRPAESLQAPEIVQRETKPPPPPAEPQPVVQPAPQEPDEDAPEAAAEAPVPAASSSKKDLASRYEAKFGQPPPVRWSAQRIADELAAGAA